MSASVPVRPATAAEPLTHPAQTRAAASDETRPPTIRIAPRSPWQLFDVAELWRYRELLFFLVWRDVKVRYKQTVLGVAWVVLQPLAYMVVFTFFLARAAGEGTGNVPYPLLVLAGLLPWIFFSSAINAAAVSLIGNQNLITKVYFPRVMVPMSAAGAGLVDFAISGGVLAIALLYFGVWPKLTVLLLPAIVLLLIVAAMGMGILLSALTVHYRDFRHLLTFLMQLWMFATPAIYLPSVGKDLPQGGWWLALNPAQGLIQNFRAAALGLPLDYPALVLSAAVGLGLAVLGAYYFRRVERSFADVL